MAAKHEEWWARVEEKVDATFQELFSETSSMDSVRHFHCCLSWCFSHILLEWGTGHHCAMESGDPYGHHHSRVRGPKGLSIYEQPSMPHLDSATSHPSPVKHFPQQHPSSRTFFCWAPLDPQYTKWDHTPQRCSQWSTQQEGSCQNCWSHLRHAAMVCVPLGALKNTTVRATLITVVMGQPKTNWGRMWPTLIWNQPQGIVSLVQIRRRWSLEWHERDSGKGCRPPVALWGAAFGLRSK